VSSATAVIGGTVPAKSLPRLRVATFGVDDELRGAIIFFRRPSPGVHRTLGRRIRAWRAVNCLERDVIFRQASPWLAWSTC